MRCVWQGEDYPYDRRPSAAFIPSGSTTMSTWHDLIDDSSVERFFAGINVIVPAEEQGTTERNPLSSNENSSYGMTILSSVETVNELNDGNMHATSISTHLTEEILDRDERANRSSILTDSSSLTLNASSVDSSLMTEFTETSSLTESSVSDISESDTASLSELSMVESTTSFAASKQSSTELSTTKEKRWFSQFRTEQEWHDYRTSVVDEVIKAMDDCPAEERDALLAELIANEEHVFWGGHEDVYVTEPESSWIWEALAVAGTLALVGAALIRMLKSRA